MAFHWKLFRPSSKRLIPAECARHRIRAVSASFCNMLPGEVASFRAKAIKARFSSAWFGGCDGRRLNSAVEITDSNSDMHGGAAQNAFIFALSCIESLTVNCAGGHIGTAHRSLPALEPFHRRISR